MSDEEKVKVKDKSNDKKYFIVTPRLVWALCDDPYEYTFWSMVKDIAGEDGECILSRDDMATLAMMSGGKASKCRDRLISKKLLEGDFRRDPGYPQSVWHLSIPDFWEANIRWARKYISLRDRINYKREQLSLREPSPGDGSSEESSLGDRGGTPRDGGLTPGDTKKNVLKNQKEEEDISPQDSSPVERLFSRVLETLKPDLKGNSYVFLSSASPVSFEDNVLTLSVADESTREWLADRLVNRINRLLPGMVKHEAAVEFVVRDSS